MTAVATPADELKLCVSCSQRKPLSDFSVQRKVDRPGALPREQISSRCRPCESVRLAERKAAGFLSAKRSAAPAYPVTMEIVTITPDIAAAWLDQNHGNRDLVGNRVKQYAHDMGNGNWRMTGEPIQFSPAGRLLNGQHRLNACVMADTAFTTVVMYGIEDDAQEAMDDGMVRKAQDVISLQGINNSARVTSAVRFLLYYKGGATWFRSMSLSRTDIVAGFRRHPNITKSVGMLGNMPRRTPLAALGFLHYAACFFLDKRERADAMVKVWATGIPDYEGDPMHLLRERLINDSKTNRTEDIAFTLYYAWNLFSERVPRTLLKMQKELCDIDGLDRARL